MNRKSILLCLVAALSMASVVAHAGAHAVQDPVKPGAKLNGTKFNGMRLNGPGIVLQARRFNGIELNGPGLILQARNFNGFNLNGLGSQLLPVSIDACVAPQPARSWPLSAIQSSHVKVRLATR